jgi:hypothetical protein
MGKNVTHGKSHIAGPWCGELSVVEVRLLRSAVQVVPEVPKPNQGIEHLSLQPMDVATYTSCPEFPGTRSRYLSEKIALITGVIVSSSHDSPKSLDKS